MSRLVFASILFVFTSANSFAVFVPSTDRSDWKSCAIAEAKHLLTNSPRKIVKIENMKYWLGVYSFDAISADGELLKGRMHPLRMQDQVGTKLSNNIHGYETVFEGKTCFVDLQEVSNEAAVFVLADVYDRPVFMISGSLGRQNFVPIPN